MQKNLKSSFFIILFALFHFTSCTKNEVTNLTLSFPTKTFIIGQTDSLIATVTASGDLNNFPVSWATSNNNVVSVTDGKIIGLAGGTAIITAKSGDITATCEVTVNNEIATVMNLGGLVYWGDEFNNNMANLFQVGLAGPNDTLYFNINAPLLSVTELAIGNYTILSTIDVSFFQPFTVIPGFLYNGQNYCSWYVSKITSPIVAGNFEVKTSNSGNCVIEFNLIDGFGNTIYGSFQGSLNYIDKSSTKVSSFPTSIKSQSKMPQFNLFENRKQIELRTYLKE